MKNSIKILLLFLCMAVFACGLGFWAEYSPVVYDYRTMQNPVSDTDLLFAFATALRINHPAAYDMIDPSLKPRLDEWMNTHQSEKCESIPDYFSIDSATKRGSKVVCNCFGNNGRFEFIVDNIVINHERKVIDWGGD